MEKKRLIFVDIDETICTTQGNVSEARDYSQAVPMMENIEYVNSLFDLGHTIVYWTARGSGTGIDWSDVTMRQFENWGVKFHDVRFGKPVYDLFIDDKSINSSEMLNALRFFEDE